MLRFLTAGESHDRALITTLQCIPSERTLAFKHKLSLYGSISLTAPEGFTKKNLNRTHAENVEAMRKQTKLHLEKGLKVPRIGVMAAFGCNYQGDIAPAQVVKTLDDGLKIADEAGARIELFSLADTMGWATPDRIERVIGAVRARWPNMAIALHLHDTRGQGLANLLSALKSGITSFDTSFGGLGGCPFIQTAKGNIATEDTANMLHEMGIQTGVDVAKIAELSRKMESYLGKELPAKMAHLI